MKLPKHIAFKQDLEKRPSIYLHGGVKSMPGRFLCVCPWANRGYF